MNRKLALVVAAISLSCALANADMYLQGVGTDHARSFKHDRFYSGADKAFIGEAYDWSGVGSGGSGNGPWATMISPSYFVSAAHYGPGAGSYVTFRAGNSLSSPAFTYYVESAQAIDGTDLLLGHLSTPVDASIATYPIWVPPTSTGYVGQDMFIYGVPNRVGRNVVTSVSNTRIYFKYSSTGGDGEDEAYLISGDSGGPSFGYYGGNQLAVVGVHYHNSGSTAYDGASCDDSFIPAHLAGLLDAMGSEYYRIGPVNYWQKTGSAGSWSTSSYWTSGAPITQMDISIANGGTAQYTSSSSLRLNSLAIGSSGGGRLDLSAGGLTITTTATIGSGGAAGQGTLNLSGGTNAFGAVTMGSAASSGGACALSGSSTSLTTTSLTIGDAGTGTFTQTAGTHTAGAIVLGKSTGGSGSYSLSGGTLTLTTLTIGDAGTGTFTQSNVALSPSSVAIGKSATGVGNYTFSTNLTTGNVTVGDAGRGTLTQNGGSVSASSVLAGNSAGAIGSYNINGGSLTTGAMTFGNGGSGTLTQSVGTISATSLTLGSLAGSSGTYTMGGGSLTCGSLLAGGAGSASITQNAGTISLSGDLTLGQSAAGVGAYHINGGSLSARNLTVGGAGAGTLAIDNSAASITLSGTLAFGVSANLAAAAGSIITLNGGNLTNAVTDSTHLAGLNNLGLVLHSTVTQTMEAAGRNIGLSGGGFTNNYKLSSLQVGTAGSPATVQLVDSVKNNPSRIGKDAMHVDSLSVAAGSTLNLNGLNLYYHTIDNQGTITLNGGHLFRDNLTTLRVWLEMDRVAVGSDFDVRIYAQILDGWSGEGLSDFAVNVYSPASVGAFAPKQVGTVKKTVKTVWNPDIVAVYSVINAAPNDFDNDGDLDAKQMTIGDMSGFIPDLGLAPVLLATQTWTKLAEDPIGLAVSATETSRHYDRLLDKQSFGWHTGDFSRDGVVDGTDINAVYRNFGSSGTYDLTGDGTVNQADVDCLVRNVLGTGYGDANVDGMIDFLDFQALLDYWQGPGGWTQGDFNGDHVVDYLDFQALLDNWNPTGISVAQTPEPASVALLCAGILFCFRRRRMTQ